MGEGTRAVALLAAVAIVLAGPACGDDGERDEPRPRAAQTDDPRPRESPDAAAHAFRAAARSRTCAGVARRIHSSHADGDARVCRAVRRLGRGEASVQPVSPIAVALHYTRSEDPADDRTALLVLDRDRRYRFAEVGPRLTGLTQEFDARTDRAVRRAVEALGRGDCDAFARRFFRPRDLGGPRRLCRSPQIRRFRRALRAGEIRAERSGTTGYVGVYRVSAGRDRFALIVLATDDGYDLWFPYRTV